jgi:tRNA1Val (adenine37-N6)-methyltransferase
MSVEEKKGSLGGGVFILTTKTHGFGAASVLLADFSSPKPDEKLCDLGTGCGIIPHLWRKKCENPIDAVEIQRDAALLSEKSARLNGFENFKIHNEDLRNTTLKKGVYGLITCNPPFKKLGTGALSQSGGALTAKHETACTLEEISFCAAGLLKEGGRFCVCQRPERIADVLAAMRAANLEPKRLRLVQQKTSSRPWLLLAEAKKGAGPGAEILPALVMESESGGYTAEVINIYGEY